MANNAFPTRPFKRPRIDKEPKTTASHAPINGFVEPPLSYVPSSTVRPVNPTLSDVCPVEGLKTTIVSRRYRDKCGDPIFTVRLERIDTSDEDPADFELKEVGFDDIEDYVSKAELERFETTWYDPDEVMPGVVIGAPGFEKTQTWDGPSTTSTSDEGSQRSAKRAKKAPTKAFVDMLPPIRRRGRPPKKTAAIMGIGPAVNTHDGHQSEEESFEFDADIEDEVDPANVRGTGGFVLIPPSRSASAVSSQPKASANVEAPVRKLPVVPERPSSASEDKDSASEDEEPDELLMGFNPHRTRDQDQSSARASSFASSSRRPGGRGRPRKSAEPRSGSLLAYVESNHTPTNPPTRKSPMQQLRSPTYTNIPAEKAVQEEEEEAEAVPPDNMPVTYQSIERDDLPTNYHPPLAPATTAEVDHQPHPNRQVEIIEISSDSESELSPSPLPSPSPAQPVRLSPEQQAEFDRRAEAIRIERAALEVQRERLLREREEEHRRNFQAEEEERERIARAQAVEREQILWAQEEERQRIQWAQQEQERIRLAQQGERQAYQQPPPAPVQSPYSAPVALRPSPTAVRSPISIRRRGSSGAVRSPTAMRRSFGRGGRPQIQPPVAAGTSADNAICIDDDEDSAVGHNDIGNIPNDQHYEENLTDNDDTSSITHSERPFNYSSVIDHKKENGVFIYLVKWDEKPHPPEDESWFPEDEMGAGGKVIVENYLRELRKPSSPKTLMDPKIELNVRPRWRRLKEKERALKAQERARREQQRARGLVR